MRRLFIFTLLFLLSVSISQAQDDTIIHYGDNLTIPASADDTDIRRTFLADAGDIVGINLSSSFGNATRLTIFNDTGDIIIEGIPLYSPHIETGYFSIPEAGEYTILVTLSEITAEVDDFGCYELSLYQRVAPTLPKNVAYFDNNLTASVLKIDFVFEGIAGDVVSIYAESDRFDPTMILYAPDGTEIASDEDSGGNLNPAIEALTLEYTGQYRVVIPNPEQADGTIYLTLIDYQTPDLSFDDSISLTIQPENDPMMLTIEGQTGDVVSIRSDNLEDVASIQILDSNGDELATNQNWIGLEQIRLETTLISMASILITPLSTTPEKFTLTLEQNLRREISDDGLLFHLSPEHPIQTFTIKDPTFTSGGSFQGGELNIVQAEYRQAMPFRITLMQDNRVVLSYVVDDLMGASGLNNVLRFGSGVGFGAEVTGTIELLGDSFAVFRLSNRWLLGIG